MWLSVSVGFQKLSFASDKVYELFSVQLFFEYNRLNCSINKCIKQMCIIIFNLLKQLDKAQL